MGHHHHHKSSAVQKEELLHHQLIPKLNHKPPTPPTISLMTHQKVHKNVDQKVFQFHLNHNQTTTTTTTTTTIITTTIRSPIMKMNYINVSNLYLPIYPTLNQTNTLVWNKQDKKEKKPMKKCVY